VLCEKPISLTVAQAETLLAGPRHGVEDWRGLHGAPPFRSGSGCANLLDADGSANCARSSDSSATFNIKSADIRNQVDGRRRVR